MPNKTFWKPMMDWRPPISFKHLSFKGNWFSCNKVGHKENGCKNQIRNYSFNGNLHYCNKFGHKASECRNKMNMNRNVRYFNGGCYVWNGYGHNVVECKMNKNFRRNVTRNMMWNDLVCYNCNVVGHIAKLFKRSKGRNASPENVVDSKGKGKTLWVKK